MPSAVNTILQTALGSAEASIAVLLVLGAGYFAQHIGWVNEDGEKQISHLCVTVFLPGLLFTQIGPHATPSNVVEYGIIIVLSIFAMSVSYLAGTLTRRTLKAPRWTVAAFMFNNATSLPLLLLDSLEKTDTIRLIIGKNGGSVSDAVSRGRTYLLIASLIGNVGRFTFGPDIMSHNNNNNNDSEGRHPNGLHGTLDLSSQDSETAPLLSTRRIHSTTVKAWPTIKKTAKTVWAWISDVLNPPLIAAIVAVFFGLVPPLRHAFFKSGNPLNATITQSIDYMGKLYTALQIFVLGSKLRSKRGENPPVASSIILFIHRFAVMPAIMISIMYFLRSRWPSYVERDPMLDFVLSIVGVGPPAITLAAIADMADLDSHEDGQVARMLTISYLVTPLISIPLSVAVYVVQQLGVARE